MKTKPFFILMIFALSLTTVFGQQISSNSKSVHIDNTPKLIIKEVKLIDGNRNNMIDAGENCHLEVTLINKGNGPAKAVNLDAMPENEQPKGFSWAKSSFVGNMPINKEKKIILEIYPKVNLADGDVNLKIEALEANGYSSAPQIIKLKTKSAVNQLAVGWNFPLSKNTTVYESQFEIETCIMSKDRIDNIQVVLNGEVVSESKNIKMNVGEDCHYLLNKKIKLRNGANRIIIKAISGDKSEVSDTRFVSYIETRLESRIALVIGNSAYNESPLKNPANDARDMAITLRGLNFDVIEIIDGKKEEMRLAIRNFSYSLGENKGVGLFYYAGHGMQVGGENYLIPVDHEIFEEYDVPDEAVRVTMVLDAMESSGTRMNIVILDACRNNPYARSMRSGTRGLAQITAEGSGSIIAYATSPGSVASDGDGKNGLYTQELLKAINTEGVEIGMVFRNVLTNVKKISGSKQIPWTNSSIEGEFYFKR